MTKHADVSQSMRRVFFRNNLFAFLALLFLPIVIMGSLSMYLLHGYIRKNLDTETQMLLEQMVGKVDLITDQFNPLILTVDIDGQSSYVARKLLDSVQMTYTDIFLLNSIKDQLSSLSNARPYIHSIILYFVNDNNYYLSNTGKHELSSSDFYWFEQYQALRYKKERWTHSSDHRLAGGNSYQLLSLFHILGNGEGVIVFNLRPDIVEPIITEGLSDAGHYLHIHDDFGNFLLGSSMPIQHANAYLIRTAVSERTGWRLTLFSDKKVVFQVYRNVLALILLFSAFSLVTGLVLSIWLTKRRTRQVYAIINLLEAASRNEDLPPIPKRQGPTYGYIIHRIVNSFLHQSFLKTQLEARKYKLKTAQLMALQAQLNPHFLFNTLETLNWKVYEMTNQPNEANLMIEHLSELMRYSLNAAEDTVTLEEEIESIKSYLALQKIRYEDKFETYYDLAPGVETSRMPRMILQPIVENALYHGIKPSDHKGRITIKADVLDDNLVISISDDGVGMEAASQATLLESFSDAEQVRTDHIGLANVHARLYLLYGRSLHIESEQNKGTTITLTIPQN